MAPATFTNVCKSAKIAIPSPNYRAKYLADAGLQPAHNITIKELLERCATLAWARDSLANTIDPETWPTTLDPSSLQSSWACTPYLRIAAHTLRLPPSS